MRPRLLRRAMLGAAVSMCALPSLAAHADARDLPAIWASARDAGVARAIDAPDASDASARMPSDDARERDAAARIDANKSYAIPALEIVGFEVLLNQFDRHVLGDDFASNASTIRHNLHSSWVEDRDPFQVDQLGHPYAGSIYQGFAPLRRIELPGSAGLHVRGQRLVGDRGRAEPADRFGFVDY